MLPLLACSILFQYGIPPEYSSIKWYPSPSFGSENRIILQESTHHHFLMKSYWHCHLKQLFLPPFSPFFPSQGGRPILSVVASCSHRRPLRSKASQRSSWVSNGFFLWNFRNLRMDFWMDYLIEFGLLEVLPRFICAQFSLDPQDSEFECTTPLTSGWTRLMTSNVSLENHRNCVGGRGERWKISPRHPRMWSVAHEVLATCSASGCLAAQMSESIAGHELNIGLNDIKIIKNHQKASKIIKNHQKHIQTCLGLGLTCSDSGNLFGKSEVSRFSLPPLGQWTQCLRSASLHRCAWGLGCDLVHIQLIPQFHFDRNQKFRHPVPLNIPKYN